MRDRLKDAFGQIQVGDALKNRTKGFLAQQARRNIGVKRRKRLAYAAVCLLLLLTGGRWLYFTPTAEIIIDINPSLELGVNRFDRIISVNGSNPDGQRLSSGLNIRHQTYANAVDQILKEETVAGLLSSGEAMAITVTGPDTAQSAEILSGIAVCTAEQRNARCYYSSAEEVAAARAAGLSCGKYQVFLEIQAIDPTVTPASVQGMTMRELQNFRDCLLSGGGSAEGADALAGECRQSGGCGRGYGKCRRQNGG